jgi:hypothetical protein
MDLSKLAKSEADIEGELSIELPNKWDVRVYA